MNERIRELAKQARYDSKNEKHYLERVHNREITLDEYQEIYDKKFAELIIQECLLSLEPNLYESEIEYRVDQAIYKRCERIILKHFGVDNERTS